MADNTDRVPANLAPTYAAVVPLTHEFCGRHLTEEYRELARNR